MLQPFQLEVALVGGPALIESSIGQVWVFPCHQLYVPVLLRQTLNNGVSEVPVRNKFLNFFDRLPSRVRACYCNCRRISRSNSLSRVGLLRGSCRLVRDR